MRSSHGVLWDTPMFHRAKAMDDAKENIPLETRFRSETANKCMSHAHFLLARHWWKYVLQSWIVATKSDAQQWCMCWKLFSLLDSMAAASAMKMHHHWRTCLVYRRTICCAYHECTRLDWGDTVIKREPLNTCSLAHKLKDPICYSPVAMASTSEKQMTEISMHDHVRLT